MRTAPSSAPVPAKSTPRVPRVLLSAPLWCPLLSSRAPIPNTLAGKGQEPRAEPHQGVPGAGILQQAPSCPPRAPESRTSAAFTQGHDPTKAQRKPNMMLEPRLPFLQAPASPWEGVKEAFVCWEGTEIL